jgi:hypothetical protein
MNKNKPTHFSQAFVRVSKCPICGYSLKDLAEELPCPECGVEIIHYLVTHPDMKDAVWMTRRLSALGSVGWFIFAIVWFFVNVGLSKSFSGNRGPIPISILLSTSMVSIAGLSLAIYLGVWWIQAKKRLYWRSANQNKSAKTPIAIFIIGIPGLIAGVLCCTCLMIVISSNS